MVGYFVDTWFFIAFLNKRDPHHDAVLRLAYELRESAFFTHDGVLSELLTFFAGHGSFWRREAAALAYDVISSRKYKVVPMTRELFAEALTLYGDRLDKEYSLVDCASMRIMLRRDLTHALTNDHHFQQEGFQLVNE